MHDLDRQQLEQEHYEGGRSNGQPQQFLGEVPLHESQELELAAELLEISNEDELEQFLGDLWKVVTSTAAAAPQAVRSARNTARGETVASAIKGSIPIFVAKAMSASPTTQPFAAAGALGARALLDGLDKLVKGEVELEGLSGEDREFELARRFVRFAGQAMANAVAAPPGVPPGQAARAAVIDAARRYVPRLVPELAQASRFGDAEGVPPAGRWVRRGSTIVIDLG